MTNLEKANAIWKEAFGIENRFTDVFCPFGTEFACHCCPLRRNDLCKPAQWWNREYKGKIELKPITDWSKVAVDTLIIVKASDYGEEYKRYFAKYERGTVYAWAQGRTSVTAFSVNDIKDWKFAILAESEDING